MQEYSILEINFEKGILKDVYKRQTIGSTELVIGHNPKAPNPDVCWYCKGGDNYFWGHYCNAVSYTHLDVYKRQRFSAISV